jgi:hypothetical protein
MNNLAEEQVEFANNTQGLSDDVTMTNSRHCVITLTGSQLESESSGSYRLATRRRHGRIPNVRYRLKGMEPMSGVEPLTY